MGDAGSAAAGSAVSAGSGSAVSGSAGYREKTPVEGSGVSSFAPMPTTGEARGVKAVPADSNGDAADAVRRGTSAPVDEELDASTAGPQDAPVQAATPLHVAKTSGKRHGQMAQVVGVRHWSTPDYTRVAIDLGDDGPYEAARVPNPDRFGSERHGTRVAQGV